MKKIALSIGMMVFSIFVVVLVIVLVNKASTSDPMVTSDDIEIAILSTEKQQDNSIYVTAEITNNSHYTIERNRLFVTALSDGEGAAHTHESVNTGGGVATADDPPKHISVQELEGSFEHIRSNESVKIRFVVPSEYALSRPLYVVFQSGEIRGQNTVETRAITVTEPLLLPD